MVPGITQLEIPWKLSQVHPGIHGIHGTNRLAIPGSTTEGTFLDLDRFTPKFRNDPPMFLTKKKLQALKKTPVRLNNSPEKKLWFRNKSSDT